MISAKRLGVLYSINKENSSRTLLNMKRLRSKTLSTFWQEITAHNYNVQMQERQLEQEADARFSQRQKGVLSRFSQEASQALENQRESLVTEGDIRSVERRRGSVRFTYRTQSSITALGGRYGTTKSRARWTASASGRIGSGDTAVSRDFGRNSSCSNTCWIKN